MEGDVGPWPDGLDRTASASQGDPKSTPAKRPATSMETDLAAFSTLPIGSTLDFTQALQAFDSANGALWTPLADDRAKSPLASDSEHCAQAVDCEGPQHVAYTGLPSECFRCPDPDKDDTDLIQTKVTDRGQLTEGKRTRSLPNVIFPLGMNLSAGAATQFDDGLRHARSCDALPGGSMPFCSFSTYDGQLGPARPAAEPLRNSVEVDTPEAYRFGSSTSRVAAGIDRQTVRHDVITSRVEVLNLATVPTSAPNLAKRDLCLIDADILGAAATQQEKLGTTFSGHYGMTNMNHTTQLDVSSRDELIGCQTSAGIEHNPMWGSATYHAQSSFESDTAGAYMGGSSGQGSFMATSSTSDADSSQWQQHSAWPTTSPWQHQNGEPSPQDGLVEAKFRNASGYETTTSGTQRAELFESSLGRYDGVIRPREGTATPAVTYPYTVSSSRVTSGSPGVGRMEEGCIGSKKRVWFRAPNGQFASATRVTSEVLAANSPGQAGQSGSGTSSSIRRIRRRRKSEEVDRKYRCDYERCDKAYGTLNHLNTHRATNGHGPRLNAVGYRRAFAEWQSKQQGDQQS